MSAERPEVGDVFLQRYREIKFDVFKIENNEIYFLFLIDGVPQCMTARIDRVSTDYKFLVKSKANINELFEVNKELPR